MARPTPAAAPLSPTARTILGTLAGQLRAARLERRMPQTELAERLGVSRYTVMAIERGDPGVAIGTVLEAAVIVGVPLMADDPRDVQRSLSTTQAMLRLLPSRIRAKAVRVDDDF